jgi:LemA protein
MRSSLRNQKAVSALIVGLIILAIVGGSILVVVVMYNGLVSASVKVDQSWSEVRNQYQRQADLIPNLVNTAKGYIQYEGSILQNITNARTNWLNAQAQSQLKQDEAGLLMNLATGTFLSSTENYPDLKADKVIINLMDELSGTQNRIAVARGRYIENIGSYNIAVRTFPGSLFGFPTKDFYQGNAGIEQPPTVTFP